MAMLSVFSAAKEWEVLFLSRGPLSVSCVSCFLLVAEWKDRTYGAFLPKCLRSLRVGMYWFCRQSSQDASQVLYVAYCKAYVSGLLFRLFSVPLFLKDDWTVFGRYEQRYLCSYIQEERDSRRLWHLGIALLSAYRRSQRLLLSQMCVNLSFLNVVRAASISLSFRGQYSFLHPNVSAHRVRWWLVSQKNGPEIV